MAFVPFKTNHDLTVTSNISASNLVYDGTNNSSQWNTAYASTTALNTNFSKLSSQAYSLNVNNNILPSYTGNSFTGTGFSYGTQTNAILAGTGNNIMVAEGNGGNTNKTVILNGTNNCTSVNYSTIVDSILFGNSNKLNTDSGYNGLLTSIIGGSQNTTSNSGYRSQITNTFNFGAGNIICTANDGNNNYINYSNILGNNNSICASNFITVNNSNILGGNNKICNLSNVYILGSNIAASCANYTYVNNLSSQGIVSSLGGNSNQWNSVYSLVNTTTATTFKVNNLNASNNISAVNVFLGTTALTATLNSAPLTITSAANGSVYNAIQNTVAGVSASTDISLYNNDGINYLDLGIASTKYDGNLYSPTFNVVNGGDSYVYATSANLVLGAASTTSNLTFFTGGTLSGAAGNERMRINSSGNVGIGTLIPNQKLTVSGSISSTNAIYVSALNITSTPTTFINPVTASGTFLIVNVNGTNQAIQLWNYTS